MLDKMVRYNVYNKMKTCFEKYTLNIFLNLNIIKLFDQENNSGLNIFFILKKEKCDLNIIDSDKDTTNNNQN